jgi:fatty acid desaturase
MTVTAAPPTRTSDFAALSARITAAGLMKRRHGYYAVKIAGTLAMFAAGWAAFVVVGASWWTLAIAAFLGFATTQVAFLGHDFAHRQVFRKRGPSELAGLFVGNFCISMSLGWWTSKHTRHHANPNHEDHDPDVATGALVWTKGQAEARTGFMAWLGRNQAYIFFPILFLEGLNLKVASVKEILTTPMRHRRTEGVLITLSLAIYLTAIFMVLPIGMAFAFIAIHQALFGFYMGVSFAPNHKGMKMLTAEDDLDFLRKQVLTSRNVNGSRHVDFLLGGLNYQIEHHLFPSMARCNLRKAQPIVEEFCRENDVSYLSTGVIDSYRQGLGFLDDIGNSANVVEPVPALQIA